MLTPDNIITSINSTINPFFLEGQNKLQLHQYRTNVLRLRIASTMKVSTAINQRRNDSEEVPVINWFSNFWLFIEIRLLPNEGILVSLSIFHGDAGDSRKTQLFRAEWDEYFNIDDMHAQPHWHFLPNYRAEEEIHSFKELMEQESGYLQELKNDFNLLDIGKFHFAMFADWFSSNTVSHKIESSERLSKWMEGLLIHLKKQLEYVVK